MFRFNTLIITLLVATGCPDDDTRKPHDAAGDDDDTGPMVQHVSAPDIEVVECSEPVAFFDAGSLVCSEPNVVFEGVANIEVFADGLFLFDQANRPAAVFGLCYVESVQ